MTAQQHLATYGISMQTAYDFVAANLSTPQTILDVSKQFGVTNAMLAEIASIGIPNLTVDLVKSFFAQNGLDSSTLDSAISTLTSIITNVNEGLEAGGTNTIAVSAAGETAATTAKDVFNMSSTSSYNHSISGFDLANDKLSFGSGVTVNSINLENMALDGKVSLSYTNGANTAKITLIGLSQAQEENLATSADFATLLM